HPFMTIDNASNRAIQWRLLVPIIWRVLHLPPKMVLAVPFLGCLATLGYIAHLVLREGERLSAAFATAVIFACCPWFFVSTGWLSYEDSWTVLGLLLIAFGRPRVAIVLACAFEPFIDERFVFGLPLAVVMRCVFFDLLERGARQT